MSKLITVFGATGQQGGSTIKYILEDVQLSKEYKIRGITRDTSKESAQDLAKQGVEVVSADMNSVSSLKSALSGSHTVYLVTNYWEYGNGETEFRQGKNVTDVAKEVGVSSIIFSSLMPVAEVTKGRLSNVPHFDSKARVETYIKESGLHCIFVQPGYFMGNYLQMFQKGQDGSFQLYYPVDGKTAKFPLFDAAGDTGLFVKAALKNSEKLNGQRLYAATDYYTAEEIVDTFSKVTGKNATFIQVNDDQFKAALPDAIAQEYLENHLFIADPGYFLGESLDGTLSLLDSKPTEWAGFVKKNLAAWA